jgi:beta-lactamase superfamily II metal-dependent hydrolase
MTIAFAARTPAASLDVYVIDVEGGKSLLVVTPAGESLLIDAGWAPFNGRESSTGRIAAALRTVGLKQIDYLVISHFDVDHIGDVPGLAAKIPIRHIVDRGGGPANSGNEANRKRFEDYAALYQSIDHIQAKAGEKVPLRGVDALIVSAANQPIRTPVQGDVTVNPRCADAPRSPSRPFNEDNSSVGLLFTYGKFKMLDLADLLAGPSSDLVCPDNLIGTVDVYNVNVHGQLKGMSAELVAAVKPRVAIMGNGATKGGDAATWDILRGVPEIEDIWQSHYSAAGGRDKNPAEDFIANLEPSTPDPNDKWNMVRISAESTGAFTITNDRNGFSKTYKPR